MSKNAYFRVRIENSQTFLDLYGATDGGEELVTSEVSNYLSSRNISFDLVALDRAVKENSDVSIKLEDEEHAVEAGSVNLTVSDDKMTAYARFYPPFKGGTEMIEADIISDLKFNGIKYGTNKEAIETFLSKREYCKTFEIAIGLPVTEGSDAEITYLFNTDLSGRPAVNEDGSVDFHNLNTVCHINAGDELAKMKPAVNGRAGMTVLGEIIKPRDVKKAKFQYGKNIAISEDGLTMISEITGLVNLVDEHVFVSNIMEVNDVDASTGDIDFDGGILVRGDVKTGYRVKATGDIEIKGAVENSYVEAGGQIIVARGINGNSKGTLKARTNVISKYIQNAIVIAGGYVETDCVIHSDIVAGTRVCVQGRKGFINGGSVRARDEVEVKTLGSAMGTDTTIEVGTDPALRDKYNFLKKEMAEISKSLAQNEPLAVALIAKIKAGTRMSPDQIKQAQELAKLVQSQKEKLKNDMEEMSVLEISLDAESEAIVRVTGVAHPGAIISISGATLTLKTEYQYCRFRREGADVVMVAI